MLPSFATRVVYFVNLILFVGLFECVQIIRQQHDTHRHGLNGSKQTLSSDGYLIFAYKTMEDMCTKDFAASWKTWTGARLLCQLLPHKYTVKRLSFFKKLNGSTQFAYILIAQIADLMKDCAPVLNVLNCLRPKICAFVGAYRIVTFKVTAALCNALNISEDQHLYVYTSSLKVSYSNHTAFASYPEYNEFRGDDEKKEKNVGTTPEVTRKSSETQTDPIERPMARRTLPRTISIYDFPSMKNSTVMTHKEVATEVDAEVRAVAQMGKLTPDRSVFGSREPLYDKKGSPIPVALVHPLPCSPTGVWVRRNSSRKPQGAAVFQNECPFPTADSECSRKTSKTETIQKEPADRVFVDLVQSSTEGDDPLAKDRLMPRRAHSEVRTSDERRKLHMTEDGLLQRLKTNYFNSPEYTSAELRAIDSE